jgi:CAAX protease family protein
MIGMKRFAAVLEAIVITALTWAAYKAMKLLEPGGFNYSPGLAMLVAASILSIWHWREFSSYGIASVEWRSGVNLGVAFTLFMLLGGAIELALFPSDLLVPSQKPLHVGLRSMAFRIPFYLAILLILLQMRWRQPLERAPLAFTLSILAALLIAAPALAVYRGAPPTNVACQAASLVFFTGVGEEVFFRGYVQSRLNGVFGRPWRFLGASLGHGLFISSLLFGLIHVFNPTKPYEGHWEVSWLWGVGACFGGLLYGYLRELTGSIWTATIIHALSGEYQGIWQVFLSKR